MQNAKQNQIGRSNAAQTSVAVVGLGAMGSAIAANLVRSGYRVTAWNRTPEAMAVAVQAGATAQSDLAEAAHADVVLSVLFDDAAVQAVLLDGAFFDALPKTSIHVCMSTLSLGMAVSLARAHAERGLQYVAATMFGRPEAAAATALTIVAAGASESIAVVVPVLSVLGSVHTVGALPHHANLTKIAGNFLIASSIEAMAEANAILTGNGANSAAAFDIYTETLFAAPIYRIYAPCVSGARDPASRSGLALPLKDVGLARDCAAQADVTFPLGELLNRKLRAATDRGFGDDDWSTALAAVAMEKTI